jgi:hypothetical protein
VNTTMERRYLPFVDWIHTSAAVSTLYLTCSVVCYVVARDMEVPRLVRFLARNTVFIFIAPCPCTTPS